MKYLTITLLCLSLLIVSSCSTPQEPEPEEPEPVRPLIVLQGANLEELGYSIATDKLQTFTDHNGEEVEYFVFHYSAYERKFTNTTVLTLDFSECTATLLLYLFQGYLKPAEEYGQLFVEVGTELYDLAKLTQHIVYEDEEVVILDVTSFYPDEWEEEIQVWGDIGVPTQWMEEVRDYVKSSSDYEIVKFK